MKKLNRNIKDFRWFLQIVQMDEKRAAAVLIGSAVTAGIYPFINLVFYARVIDLITGKEMISATICAAAMLLLLLLVKLTEAGCRHSLKTIQMTAGEQVKKRVTEKLFRIQYEKFEKDKYYELVRKIKNEENSNGGVNEQLESIRLLMTYLTEAVMAFVFIARLFAAGGMQQGGFFAGTGSNVLLICAYGFICLGIVKNQKYIKNAMTAWRKENETVNKGGSYYSIFFEVETSLLVRAYRLEQVMLGKFEEYIRQSAAVYRKGAVCSAKGYMRDGILMQAAGIAAYIIIGYKALAGIISIGSVLLYAGALLRFMETSRSILAEWSMYSYRMDFLKTYADFLHHPDLLYAGTLPVEKRDDAQFYFEFRDVSFTYPGSQEQVLSHLNLSFSVGDKMALVGRNGTGKSTVVKLLCRLYEPTGGEIFLNGINIRYYDYEQYTSLFSVVFQDFCLFSLSLAENIAGDSCYDEERVWNVLERVGMKERVRQMPDGIGTLLYKETGDGVSLSGGEAQKIAIARALYKDAPFVILDEPTAALDPLAEAEIYEKFNTLTGSKTAIYISHRMSSCKFCNTITVLSEGRVCEQGSHEELLLHGGEYSALYHTQASYYREDTAL